MKSAALSLIASSQTLSGRADGGSPQNVTCSRLTRIVASRKCATLAMLRTIWNVVELSSPVCHSKMVAIEVLIILLKQELMMQRRRARIDAMQCSCQPR